MSTDRKVLIVEDQLLIACDVERTIAEMGHTVCGIAQASADALRKARETRPDLVVVDVGLGDGSNGIELAALLKARFGADALILSGSAEKRQEAESAGFIFLQKPFAGAKLRRAVADVLVRRGVSGSTPKSAVGAFF